jgi:hypothetical protein
MRKLMLSLCSLCLATPALAEDANGIRLKMSQDFFTRQANWQIVADEASDKVYTDTMTLLNGGSRFEVTKLINPSFELGGIASYTFIDQKTEAGDGIAAGSSYGIGLTAAYNFKLGDNTKGFLQPMVGLASMGMTPEGGDEATEGGLYFGAAAGARIRLFKRVTLDPQFEYSQHNLGYAIAGEDVEDVEGRRTNMGVRWGITAML